MDSCISQSIRFMYDNCMKSECLLLSHIKWASLPKDPPPPSAAPHGGRQSGSSEDDVHMWFGRCFFTPDAHPHATLPIYPGLGAAIKNALACASRVAGEQTGGEWTLRHADCRWWNHQPSGWPLYLLFSQNGFIINIYYKKKRRTEGEGNGWDGERMNLLKVGKSQ